MEKAKLAQARGKTQPCNLESQQYDYGSGSDSVRVEPSASAKHKKGKGPAPRQEGAGPSPPTAPGNKGKVLTGRVAEDLRKKAEAKFEAELEAKLRLENKRKEKAFRDAMIGSPLGVVKLQCPHTLAAYKIRVLGVLEARSAGSTWLQKDIGR